MFLGASGQKTAGQGQWAIRYKFAANKNLTGITIGDIAGIAKKGWEYLWVRYQDVKDDAAKAMVKVPQAVYVEQVYKEGDFAGLGIGT